MTLATPPRRPRCWRRPRAASRVSSGRAATSTASSAPPADTHPAIVTRLLGIWAANCCLGFAQPTIARSCLPVVVARHRIPCIAHAAHAPSTPPSLHARFAGEWGTNVTLSVEVTPRDGALPWIGCTSSSEPWHSPTLLGHLQLLPSSLDAVPAHAALLSSHTAKNVYRANLDGDLTVYNSSLSQIAYWGNDNGIISGSMAPIKIPSAVRGLHGCQPAAHPAALPDAWTALSPPAWAHYAPIVPHPAGHVLRLLPRCRAGRQPLRRLEQLRLPWVLQDQHRSRGCGEPPRARLMSDPVA